MGLTNFLGSMFAAVALALLVSCAAQNAIIIDDFTTFNATLWTQGTGRMHDQPGPGFDARPDHLHYNAPGLVLQLDNQPNCPSGCDNEAWASGHISSVQSYCFGEYTIGLRSAHSPTPGQPTGTRAFTCYGMYSDVSAHNEISACIESEDPTKLTIGYWYDAVEHSGVVHLPFDSTKDIHTFGFIWSPTAIHATVDGKVVWSASGNAPATLPGHAMQFRLIARPLDHAVGYDGPYAAHFDTLRGEFTSSAAYGAACPL